MAVVPAAPVSVLIVLRHGRLLALPQHLVAGLATVDVSPPLPLAQPWVGGLAQFPEGPRLLIEPFGVMPTTDSRRMVAAVGLDLPGACPLALPVDGPGTLGFAQVQVGGDRLSVACPATWLRPVTLADGRSAVGLMDDGLADTFVRAA